MWAVFGCLAKALREDLDGITWHLFSKWKPTVPEIQPLADEGPSEELCQAQEASLEYEPSFASDVSELFECDG